MTEYHIECNYAIYSHGNSILISWFDYKLFFTVQMRASITLRWPLILFNHEEQLGRSPLVTSESAIMYENIDQSEPHEILNSLKAYLPTAMLRTWVLLRKNNFPNTCIETTISRLALYALHCSIWWHLDSNSFALLPFENVLLKAPIGMLLPSWLCMLPDLINNRA